MNMSMQQLSLDGSTPAVAPSAWVAPGATLIADVSLRENVSIWYAAVLRGDGDSIEIGAGSNIQDGSVVHTDPGFPVTVGAGVSVGHRAILHGCTIEDEVLIGMGAIIMNGARIGRGSLVAAGALVPEGVQIPPGSLVAGVPGKVRRETSPEEQQRISLNARTYRELKMRHASALAR
jgi:carbonic anhydrase/acetyltransferase-like protein (isoleucine patch superfamily)